MATFDTHPVRAVRVLVRNRLRLPSGVIKGASWTTDTDQRLSEIQGEVEKALESIRK